MFNQSSVDAELISRRIRLRPVEPGDYVYLRRSELSAYLAFRWRHHGLHVDPATFGEGLWAAGLFHFVVEDLRSGSPIGVVSAYGADFATGTMYLAAARFENRTGIDLKVVGAIGLAIDYAFKGWPIRKIYFESPEFTLSQYDGAIGWLLQEEARFREHVFLDGRYWDHIVLALWRENWLAHRRAIVRFA